MANLEPEQYHRRQSTVYAMQHDGTDSSARRIESWVLLNGGKCELLPVGSQDYDPTSAFVRLESDRTANLVVPTSWVVRVQEGRFYAVLDSDFHILYETPPVTS